MNWNSLIGELFLLLEAFAIVCIMVWIGNGKRGRSNYDMPDRAFVGFPFILLLLITMVKCTN